MSFWNEFYKVSKKGLIFKTCEAEIQLGTGQQASLQGVFKFSAPSPEIQKILELSQEKKLTLTYREWLIAPTTKMETDYEIIGVEIKEN